MNKVVRFRAVELSETSGLPRREERRGASPHAKTCQSTDRCLAFGSGEGIPDLLAVLRHKHRYLIQGVEELGMPRDQTTLEKFG